MFVYAGIDEAGYGPMFGPLVVARSVFAIPKLPPLPETAEPPRLWQRMSKGVCRSLSERKGGRIAVADSKRLKTQASGVKHLETGCLAFAALAGRQPACVATWLDALGEACHREPLAPWYAEAPDAPWQALPVANTRGEIAIARGMLGQTAGRIGVEVPDLGVAVVTEERFNQMVDRMRSKAAVSFHHVTRHLSAVWDQFGEHFPLVVVDRQGGRSRYREPLAIAFPGAQIRVLEEGEERSAYEVHEGARAMRVSFEVEAEDRHMPVALASMAAKYTRELFVARLNAHFASLAPEIRPTAGYGTDAKRFWDEIRGRLDAWGIEAWRLKRSC